MDKIHYKGKEIEKLVTIVQNKWVKTITAVFAVIWTLDLQTSNILSFILMVLFWMLFNKKTEETPTRRDKQISGILGAVFSLCHVWGSYENFSMQTDIALILLVKYIISAIGWWYLFSTMLLLFFLWTDKIKESEETRNSRQGIKVAGLMFLVCLLCWLPYFLIYYPGILTWDTEWQFEQALGIRGMSNHQPVIHTLLLRYLYKIGYALIGNENGGMAFCVVVQMLLMAAIFSYLVWVLYKYGLKKRYVLLCGIFFALLPFNALYSITIWKDILFSGIMLVFTIMLWKFDESEKAPMQKLPLFLLAFTLIGILFCLMRNNAFYAYIICIPFMLFKLKKQRLYAIITIVLTLGVSCLIKGPVMNAQGVIQADTAENLSIPIQHIARVVADGKELTDEERELLSQVIDLDRIPGEYLGHISDPIKTLIREKDNQEYILTHKKDFLMLWLKLGLRYPDEYLKAQIAQTKGYWTTDVQYWVTTTEVTEHADILNMYRASLLPDIFTKLARLAENAYLEIPLFGLLWSIGFYFWLMLVSAAMRIRAKRSILPFIPAMALWGTLMIATPVYAEFRYIYAMIICVPFFMGISWTKRDESKEETENEENSSLNTVL